MNSTDDGFQDAHSRGVSVTTRDLTMPQHAAGHYLDITCHDAAGHDVFDLLGGEIADRLTGDSETAAEVVGRVLAKWRRFWGQLPKQMLSFEEQLGLFAELWFLSFWLVPRMGATEAIAGWRGPLASRHDFEWSDKAIEVKATVSTRGRIHRINGLDQLAQPAHGRLLFFSLRLRQEGGAISTLPSVISACRVALDAEPEALGRFETLLAQAGYSPVYEDEYAKLRLRIVEEGLFRVADDFPRLIPSSFAGNIPVGVERVEYEVNLSAFDHLLLAVQPSAMPRL